MIKTLKLFFVFSLVFFAISCPDTSGDLPNNDVTDDDNEPVVERHIDRFFINYGEENTYFRQVFLRNDIENAVEMRFSNEPFPDSAAAASRNASRVIVLPGQNFSEAPVITEIYKLDVELLPVSMTLPAQYFVAEDDGSLVFDPKYKNPAFTSVSVITSTTAVFEKAGLAPSVLKFLKDNGISGGVTEVPLEIPEGLEPESEPTDWIPYTEIYEDWILPFVRGKVYVFAEYKRADGEIVQSWNHIFLMVEDEEFLNFKLNSIGKMDDTAQAPSVEAVEEESADGYVCSVEHYSAAPGFDTMMLLNPHIGTIYPGNIIDGESVDDGSFHEITARRRPQTLTMTNISNLVGGPVCDSSEFDLTDYNYSTFAKVHDELLGRISTTSQNAASSNWDTFIFHSDKDLQLEIGTDGSYSSYNWDADFEFGNHEIQTRAMFRYQQLYYSITCDKPGAPSEFWPIGTSYEDLGITADMSPMYVSTVNYGRMIMINVSSKFEKEHILAALKAGYDPVGSTQINIDTKVTIDNVLSESTVRGYVIGGDPLLASQGVIFKDLETLQNWISTYVAEGALFSRGTSAAPLSYDLKYVRNGFPPGKILLQTDYTIRNCKKATSKFSIETKYVYCVAHNDRGKGEPEEIYGWTRATVVVKLKDSADTYTYNIDDYDKNKMMDNGRADHVSLVSIIQATDTPSTLFTHDTENYIAPAEAPGKTYIELNQARQVFTLDDHPKVFLTVSNDEATFLNDIDLERSYILLEGEMYEADGSASEDDIVGVGDMAGGDIEPGDGIKSVTIPLNEAFGYKYIHWGSQGGKGRPTGVIAVFYITPQ